MTTTTHLHRQTEKNAGAKPVDTFTFGDLTLRIAKVDAKGVLWFFADDLGKGLHLSNIREALRSLEADERGVILADTPGGDQLMNIVSESGMYQLICTSRKKAARGFKRWLFRDVLPEIRQKGYYARPGALLPGIDPQLLALFSQCIQGQTAIAAHLSELVTIEREKLEAERARARLARFPSVSEIPRENVRRKLHELIDTAAMGRGYCTGKVWQELYLELRRAEVVDLYAKKTTFRKKHGRWPSLIELVERAGLLDIAYTTARDLFMSDIAAKPKETRLERILMREEPPTKQELLDAQEDLITEQVMAFAMSSDDLKTLN